MALSPSPPPPTLARPHLLLAWRRPDAVAMGPALVTAGQRLMGLELKPGWRWAPGVPRRRWTNVAGPAVKAWARPSFSGRAVASRPSTREHRDAAAATLRRKPHRPRRTARLASILRTAHVVRASGSQSYSASAGQASVGDTAEVHLHALDAFGITGDVPLPRTARRTLNGGDHANAMSSTITSHLASGSSGGRRMPTRTRKPEPSIFVSTGSRAGPVGTGRGRPPPPLGRCDERRTAP